MKGRFGTKNQICGVRARLAATALAAGVALLISSCGGSTNQLAAVGSSPTTAPASAAVTAPAPDPQVSGTPNGVLPDPGAAGQQYPPPIPPSSACPPSGVTVVVWAPEAAMGLRTVALRAFNCSSGNLTLTGYAGLRVLDDAGKVLPVAITHGVISPAIANPKAVDIFLKPGQSAMTSVSWRNLTLLGEVPITAPALRIVALAGAEPQDLPLTVDLGTTGKIAISAWQRYREPATSAT